MAQTLLDRFKESKLQATCNLVQHPEGAFNINGKLYRPEWGRSPMGEEYPCFFDKAPEAVRLAVAQANKVCEGRDPKQIRLEMYNDGRIKVIVQE